MAESRAIPQPTFDLPRSRWAARAVLFGLGAIAGLGHAPFHLISATFVGFAFGLWFVAAAPTVRAAAARGWFFGAGYFLVTFNWLVEPFLVDIARHGVLAPFAILAMAGGLALFWMAAAALAARLFPPGALRLAGLVLALTFAEWVRGWILTGLPWGWPAYVWGESRMFLALAWIGPLGLTLLTFALAALAGHLAQRRQTIPAVVVVGGLVWIGTQGFAPADPPGGDRPMVRLVQSNAPQDEKWVPGKLEGFLQYQLDATAAPGQPDLVVWSETSIPYRLSDAAPILRTLSVAAGGAPVLTGILRQGEAGWHNAMVLVEDGGAVTDLYDKVHLVPFGEYMPLNDFFAGLGIRGLADVIGGGFQSGEERRLIDVPGVGRVWPLICYEGVFPAEVGDWTERPDLIVLITNDAWFGRFSGPYQHLVQGRARAIEQGLPVVRVAQTGVSAVIGPRGRLSGVIELGEAGFADAALPAPAPLTLYARTGDLPLLLMLIVCTLSLLGLARRKSD